MPIAHTFIVLQSINDGFVKVLKPITTMEIGVHNQTEHIDYIYYKRGI